VFIDGRFLTASAGVSLMVHPPVKTGEATLDATHPDKTMISRNGTVLYLDGRYHMWYAAFERARERWPEGETHMETKSFALDDQFCYATSADGIRWEKPDLGVPPPYYGAEPNGCPIYDEQGRRIPIERMGMVFIDPRAPPTERLRMVDRSVQRQKGGKDRLMLFASADGRSWRRTHENVLSYESARPHLDSPNVIFWDERIEKYVAYVRRNLHGGGAQGRTVARAESADLGRFPDADLAPIVLKWDGLDPSAVQAPGGPTQTLMDFYNSSALRYPWAQDAYFMFPSAYYHFKAAVHREFAGDEPTNAGPVDIRFAASRDGIIWERFDRRPFVNLGRSDEFDAMLLYMFSGLVPGTNESELFMYYTGSDRMHGWDRDMRNKRILRAAGLEAKLETSFVSRLVVRRDGFVSVRADYTGGEFTPPSLKFAGAELVLNIDTAAAGMARVEIQDEIGIALPGYGIAEADIIHTANAINRVVSWQGRSNVASLAGRAVRLRFVMRDTDLFAFQFRGKQ